MIVTLAEIVGIVALLVAVATTLGLAAVTFLPEQLPDRARWSLAPAVGVTIAVCLLTSLNWWLPATTVVIVGLLPALIVALLTIWRRSAHIPHLDKRISAPVALLLAIVTALALPFAYQHSLGPGGLQIFDGPNYASLQYRLIHHSVTDGTFGPDWSLSVSGIEPYVTGNFNVATLRQQIGFDSFAATLDAATGLTPVQTQVSFMIALAGIGALGAYAAFVIILGYEWGALLAGALYGGPVTAQLLMDGSEGAIASLSLLFALVAMGVVALRPGMGKAPAVLFALLAAGSAAVYPVFFPAIAVTSGLVWAITVVVRSRHDAVPLRTELRRAIPGAALVLAGTALAAPFAFARSLGYWKGLLEGDGVLAGLASFHLPLSVLPGYVLGTREFYSLPPVIGSGISQLLQGGVMPLILLGLVTFAIVRLRALWPLAVLGVVMLLVAAQVSRSGCSYCVQRSLIPVGPLAGFLVAAGVAAVALDSRRGGKALAAVLLVGVLAVTWHTNLTLLRRGALGAFFMPASAVSLLSGVQKSQGPVLIEGFASSADAEAELPTALLAARGGGNRPDSPRLSVLTEFNDFRGLSYLGGVRKRSGSEFTPDYRTIVTRLASVKTARLTVKSNDGVAVQRRTRPFDATVQSGVLVNRPRTSDRRVFITGPMSFVVTGPPKRAVALSVTVGGLRSDQLGKLPRGSMVRPTPEGGLNVCIPLRGQRAVARRVVVPVAPGLTAYEPTPWFTRTPAASGGPTLQRMFVVAHCN